MEPILPVDSIATPNLLNRSVSKPRYVAGGVGRANNSHMVVPERSGSLSTMLVDPSGEVGAGGAVVARSKGVPRSCIRSWESAHAHSEGDPENAVSGLARDSNK